MAARKMKIVGPSGRPKKGDIVGSVVKQTLPTGKFKLRPAPKRGGLRPLGPRPEGAPLIFGRRLSRPLGRSPRVLVLDGAFDNSPVKRKKSKGHR